MLRLLALIPISVGIGTYALSSPVFASHAVKPFGEVDGSPAEYHGASGIAIDG
jgi:hypothetical protein